MKPGNKRRGKSLETKILVRTCWLRVDRGGPFNVTEVGEIVLGTLEWNDDGRLRQAPEAELLQTKTQTKSLSPARFTEDFDLGCIF